MLDLMTINEAAELLGVHKVTLYEAIREGRLPCVTVLGRKALSRADVLAYQKRTEGVGSKGGRPPRHNPETEPAQKNPVGRPRKAPANEK